MGAGQWGLVNGLCVLVDVLYRLADWSMWAGRCGPRLADRCAQLLIDALFRRGGRNFPRDVAFPPLATVGKVL